MIARCQEVAPCADPADAAGIVAQKFDLDEGAVGRARDRQPVDMHRIDGNEAARPSCIVSPGCGNAQARRADGRAQAQFAVEDDFRFGHLGEREGQHALDRRVGERVGAEAQEPRLQMPDGMAGFDQAPDIGGACHDPLQDRCQRIQRAEYAVIREQDPVGAPGAAGGQKMLPGAEIQAAIGPCMRDDAVIGAETGDIGCDMVDARECEMHRHAAGGEFGQIMTGVGAQQARRIVLGEQAGDAGPGHRTKSGARPLSFTVCCPVFREIGQFREGVAISLFMSARISMH